MTDCKDCLTLTWSQIHIAFYSINDRCALSYIPIIVNYSKCRISLIVFGMCGASLILEQLTSVDCRNYVFVIYDLNKTAQVMHESKGGRL